MTTKSNFEKIAQEYINEVIRDWVFDCELEIEQADTIEEIKTILSNQTNLVDIEYARDTFRELFQWENDPCVEPCKCWTDVDYYSSRNCYELNELGIWRYLMTDASTTQWTDSFNKFKNNIKTLSNCSLEQIKDIDQTMEILKKGFFK